MARDQMSEAIALASPNGHISKRALLAAQERIRQELFGNGLQKQGPAQPPEWETLRRQAAEFRELARRGMKSRAYRKKADELEARATLLEKICEQKGK